MKIFNSVPDIIMDERPLLSVRNLTTHLQIEKKTYPVVNGLSFDLYKGKTLALVGESGCGKSMTALSLMRILPQPPALPSKGEVIYDQVNLLALSESQMRKLRGVHLSMIFQDPTSALNPVYHIGDQLIEMAHLHLNMYGEEATALAIKALKDVGIASPEERLYDYPHQLSGGMRQRVIIAMALLCEPAILIADEPTTALDVTIQAQILELIKELQKRRGMALLLITHDMSVVAEMADEVIVMYASQAIEKGSISQIFDKPSHPYTQGLFHSCPSIDHSKKRLEPIKGSVPPITDYPSGCKFNPRCPYVTPICLEGEVPNFKIEKHPEHSAKCWLHQDKPLSKRYD